MWFILNKIISLFLTLSLCFALFGCGSERGYTTGNQIANKEEYIDWNALEKNSQEEASYEFQVHTVEYGRFSTVMTPISASISSMVTPNPIKAQYLAGEMEFISLEVGRFQEVKKGDVIAKVKLEIDDIDLEELNIKLTRLSEQYENFLQNHERSQKELLEQHVYSDIQSKIRDLKYQRAEFIFLQNKQNYEKQIEDMKKHISELKKNRKITSIVAPEDGYIMSVNYMRTGDNIKNGQIIANYVTADQICLEFTDNLMHYGYGMNYLVSVYVDRSNLNGNATIVSASGKQLTATWNRQSTKVKTDIPFDKLLRSQSIMLSGETSVMENVLLIPSKAVTKENDNTYVTVLKEDGSLEKRAFIAGGNNSTYYWVFDGIDEGTKVVITN